MVLGISRWRMRYRPGRSSSPWRRWMTYVAAIFVLFTLYVIYLDFSIRFQFEGKRWALPARVYARPLELFVGLPLNAQQLLTELKALNYQPVATVDRPGTYWLQGDSVTILTRGFQFADGNEPSLRLLVRFSDSQITALEHADTHSPLDLVRLDPVLFGSIYPSHHEDRVLIKLSEVPPLLVKALIVMEDRHFYQHHGIMPSAIARAALANLRAGGIAQGGSTLTQQLVKNFFLSNERTIWRKLNEAIMSLLLEFHYEKDEILEAYLNEVYLGQDGRRSIHGFGLASQFYFSSHVRDLELDQIALLVTLVRGASYYDPRRFAARAKARRDLILEKLAETGEITKDQATLARGKPLGVTKQAPSGVTRYPAFLDLVRHQLYRDYREEDLMSEGLQIFTTLDPVVQRAAEQTLSQQLKSLENQRGLPAGELEGAVVVTRRDNGEVQAVVGGRNAQFAGFNRALNAERHIGSLIKPAIYLTALEQPEQYHLGSLVIDQPMEELSDFGNWSPKNYDNVAHGPVPLYQALAHSYNLAAVRLGLDLGIDNVLDTVRRLGIERRLSDYPSMLLGAVSLSPLEIAQLYQTIAAGGFETPLRAIRAVLTVQGDPLQRYGIEIKQAFSPDVMFLLQSALQEVVRQGTATSVTNLLPAGFQVAGKTGTTDDTKDSWFAGFSQDRMAVVWLGYDDNRTTHLSGASGALQVWGRVLAQIDAQSLQLTPTEGVEFAWLDETSQGRAVESCQGAVYLPFIKGSVPDEPAPCVNELGTTVKKTLNWLKGIMQ